MNAWWLLLALGQEDRDGSQTPTLYRAEKVLFEHGDIRWLHDGQIGGFLDSVFDDPWFRRQFPKAIKPRVAVGRFSDRSYAEGGTLYFPGHPKTGRPTACNFSVLHELTHTLTPGHNHDRVFAATYAVLVTRFVSEEAGRELARSYRQNGKPGWVPKNSYGSGPAKTTR